MICASCKKETNHIIVTLDISGKPVEICHSCGRFSEAGGTSTDGLLTRNSFRIRSDSIKNEGDTLPPHEYDKSTHKFKPREEFIKRFPDRVNETFSREELNKSGYRKLKTDKKLKEEKVEFTGNSKERIKELI